VRSTVVEWSIPFQNGEVLLDFFDFEVSDWAWGVEHLELASTFVFTNAVLESKHVFTGLAAMSFFYDEGSTVVTVYKLARSSIPPVNPQPLLGPYQASTVAPMSVATPCRCMYAVARTTMPG
jgi:hypothetical protein